MQKYLSYIYFAVSALLLAFVVRLYILVKQEEPPPPLQVTQNIEVPSISIPDTLYFAGELVPLSDPDVRERLDRELHVNTFFHSNTIFLLKRGNRWLPQIGKLLAEGEIPDDLKYLAVIESDLQNKVSGRGATGFWQLMKPTAKEFGLQVATEVDERYDPIKSTYAAIKYLKRSYRKFGNWTNSAASYNSGMRALERQMTRQKCNSYYDLLLNEETSRYLFRAIAVKLIFEDPQKFGFRLDKKQLYYPERLKTVEVDQSITNLRDFAFEQGINYKLLKRYNPWLRKNTLTVRSGKTYQISIPDYELKKEEIDEPLKVESDSIFMNDSLNFTDSISE